MAPRRDRAAPLRVLNVRNVPDDVKRRLRVGKEQHAMSFPQYLAALAELERLVTQEARAPRSAAAGAFARSVLTAAGLALDRVV